MREKGADRNDLFDRLAADERLGLTPPTWPRLVAEPLAFTGAAADQVDAVVRRVEAVVQPTRGGGVLTGRDSLKVAGPPDVQFAAVVTGSTLDTVNCRSAGSPLGDSLA